MFLFRSKKNPGSITLNTIPPQATTEDAAERKARHLATLRRLTELGMDLAERAAKEAREEPTPEKPGEKPARPAANPRIVFARLSRTVRETIALEATIAAGKIPASRTQSQAPEQPPTNRPTPKDPRRAPISEYLHDAIEDSTLPKPTRATLHDQIEPLIDQHLENDPCQDHLGGEIAANICETLGIPFKTSRMQDELFTHPGKTVVETYHARQAQKSTGPDPPQN